MIEIGRICFKIAGRDAGLRCVVVEILDNNYVLIDGETRRRKCNIVHLEPLKDSIKIKKGASHEEVKKEFEKLGLEVWETKQKEKKEKPIKIRGRKKVKEEKSEKVKGKNKSEKKVKTTGKNGSKKKETKKDESSKANKK